MPSLTHDALLQLFRNRPTLAPELLRDLLHTPVPAFDQVRIGDTTLTELVPTEYRADLVLLLEGATGETPEAAIVVEAQLGRNLDKRWSWPVYLTTLRARLKCDVALVVVTSDAGIAGWAQTPIPTGHPGWVLVPLVLGPQAVPLVGEQAVAELSPELAVLSVMLHGREKGSLAVARSAIAAAKSLDVERAKLYADLVLASVDEAARAILEEVVMERWNHEYQSDFARRYVAQGEAAGRAHSLLAVLAARGLDVPDDVRAQIRACTDLARLDAWLRRAVAATSAADVVRE
jgi:hypothetical protein